MPTIPPVNEELASHSVPCPACGVPVAIGYPRCPKCKAAVPQGPRARRGSVREQLMSGGTSVEPEPSAGGTAWLPWVLVALVIVAIGAFLAFRDGGGKKAAVDPSAKTDDEDDADDDDDDDEVEPDDEVAAPRRKSTTDEPDAVDPMPAAVRAFDEALRGERLWAKVSHDGTTLVVESSLCAQIEAQLAELARPTYELGARGVECHAEHGEVMFERVL